MKWGLTMGPENSDREKSLRGRRNSKARSLVGLISKEKAHMPLRRGSLCMKVRPERQTDHRSRALHMH